MTADLTYNTDFAQVEVDERQVNLTRFSLSFPEKREFFLGGQGTFNFGRAGGGFGGGGGGGGFGGRGGGFRGGGGGGFRGGGAAPTVYYSRRIGLSGGDPVPIIGGGMVTGKAGRLGFGLMNLQTDRVQGVARETNFTVVRVKQDILGRSNIGALFTNRSKSVEVDGTNQVYGADGNFAFGQAFSVGGFYAQSRTPGLNNANESYVGRANYAGDRYGLRADYTVVGDNFNPEVGLVRRDDFRRYSTSARFSPRPQGIESIRQFRLEAGYERIESLDSGVLETEVWNGGFDIELESSDRISVAGGPQLRTSGAASASFQRRFGSSGRLRFQERDVPVQHRHTASGVRVSLAGGRRVLRRHDQDHRIQPRAHCGAQSVLSGAQRVVQRCEDVGG